MARSRAELRGPDGDGMKKFRYKLGHVAKETMTVRELREILSAYPDDMPVFGEWEGVCGDIRADSFSVEKRDWGFAEDECDVLLINVDQV